MVVAHAAKSKRSVAFYKPIIMAGYLPNTHQRIELQVQYHSISHGFDPLNLLRQATVLVCDVHILALQRLGVRRCRRDGNRAGLAVCGGDVATVLGLG